MGYKKSYSNLKINKVALVIGMLALVACSTKRVRTMSPNQANDDTVSGKSDPLLMPPSIEAKDLDEGELKLSRIDQLKRSPVAFWIDGSGYDAIESLGFMQTLEKAGIEPALVVGTGFGCWIAMSWAIDGSANRAEWQAFKWTDWKLLTDSSILNRLRGRDAYDQFSEEVGKMFPPQKLSSLRIPVDCIYLEEVNGQFFYKSAITENVDSALWRQLQNEPLLGRVRVKKEEDQTKKYSGYSFYWPEASALRFAAMEAGKGEPSYTWIVLRGFEAGKSLIDAQVKLRSQKSQETLNEMKSRGLLYVVSSKYPYTPKELKDPAMRRRLLLQGRKEGERFLNHLLKEDISTTPPAN